jgi:membrane protein YqaA with SNARE-associated domain
MMEKQGLLGVFAIALFAGSPIPVPTPNLIFIFTMGSIINPALVAVVAAFGNALGNSLVYLTGRGGLAFFKSLELGRKEKLIEIPGTEVIVSRWQRIINKFKWSKATEYARKNALMAVFILGMYPNPLLMAVVAGLGAARYNFWKFFIVCMAGKFVESAVMAYLGHFGLRSLLHFFGVHTG